MPYRRRRSYKVGGRGIYAGPTSYSIGGSGGYGRSVGRWLGAKVAQRIGLRGSVGAGIGGNIGNLVSRGLEQRIMGSGAYKTNQLFRGSSDKPPRFTSRKDETGALTITNREYVGDIYANAVGVSFSNTAYYLNPGLQSVFPWLSQIASNYEEYDFKQLMFSYRSVTSDIGASVSGQIGTIAMATQHNPTQAKFTDKNVMLQYDGAMSTRTTDNLVHGIECAKSKNAGSARKFVRLFTLSAAEDLKDYDHGILNVAVANTPQGMANYLIGELWVSYTVTLRKPKYATSIGLTNDEDIYVQANPVKDNVDWFGINSGATNYSTLYAGLYNSIGTTLVHTGTGADEDSAVSKGTIGILFPAGASGLFRISLNGTTDGTTNLGADKTINIWLTGNVTTYGCIWAGIRDAGDTPKSLECWQEDKKAHMQCYVYVSPASGNTNNMVVLKPKWSTVGTSYAPNVTAEIRVTQCNPGYKLYRNQTPVFVNRYGAQSMLTAATTTA